MANTLHSISLQISSTFYTTACDISCYAKVALGFPKLLYINAFA